MELRVILEVVLNFRDNFSYVLHPPVPSCPKWTAVRRPENPAGRIR
jgi:hypothetical protein